MTKILILMTRNFPPSNIVGALRPFRIVKYAVGEVLGRMNRILDDFTGEDSDAFTA